MNDNTDAKKGTPLTIDIFSDALREARMAGYSLDQSDKITCPKWHMTHEFIREVMKLPELRTPNYAIPTTMFDYPIIEHYDRWENPLNGAACVLERAPDDYITVIA